MGSPKHPPCPLLAPPHWARALAHALIDRQEVLPHLRDELAVRWVVRTLNPDDFFGLFWVVLLQVLHQLKFRGAWAEDENIRRRLKMLRNVMIEVLGIRRVGMVLGRR